MSLPPIQINNEYIKIPEVFFNSDTGQPFDKCTSCDKYLLTADIQYVIEKAVKQNQKYKTQDIIFEYAMCMNCFDMIRKSFSLESRQNIDQYYSRHVDMISRRKELLQDAQLDPEKWIANCLIKGTPRSELGEYQLVAQFNGDLLLFTYLPFCIGDKAMDEMAQLLSDKTLGEIDRFYNEFLGLPPELKSLFDDHRVPVL